MATRLLTRVQAVESRLVTPILCETIRVPFDLTDEEREALIAQEKSARLERLRSRWPFIADLDNQVTWVLVTDYRGRTGTTAGTAA